MHVLGPQRQHQFNMFNLIFLDKWFITGSIGSLITAATPWIVDAISPYVGFISFCGSAIVIILTIWKTSIEIRLKTRELDRDEREN